MTETSSDSTLTDGTLASAPADDGVDPGTDALDTATAAAGGGNGSRLERLEQEGEFAADYLERLLDIADLDGDIDMDVESNRATVSVVGANLSNLVGSGGEVLEALQELTRLAVQARTGERSRLLLDVSGFRAARR